MIVRKGHIAVLLVISVLSVVRPASAQIPPWERDSLSFNLEESAVTSYRKTSPISGDLGHSMSFTAATVQTFPRMFGEVDPVRVVQSLPGINASSTCDAGLHIHGFEDAHNVYTLAGAPAYLTPRMFGFFPVLNQSHFSRFRLRMDADGCYLGGSMSSELPDSLYSIVQGDASIGLMSARATVMMPLGKKAAAVISVRQSFINQVYKGLLKFDDHNVGYTFTDANASFLWHLDKKNSLDANLYYSFDKVNCDGGELGLVIGGDWQQGVASLRWKHKGELSTETVLYTTGNFKNFYIDVARNAGTTPSDLLESGIISKFDIPLGFKADLGLKWRGLTPLRISLGETRSSREFEQNTFQADLLLAKRFNAGLVSITPGVNLSGYAEMGYEKKYFYADPQVEVEVNMLGAGRLTISGKRKHQYYSQIGISTSGVPFRFWVGSGHYVDPQESHGVSLSHTVDLFHGSWSVSTQAYWARVFNQLEFRSFILDFLSPEYKLDQSMLKTDGYNYGANIMVQKNTGSVTGWISYSYSRAIRHSDESGLPPLFPASYDRPHEIDAMIAWHIWNFDVGGTLTFASGVPYTPVKYHYFIGDNIMAEYYDLNSGRVAPMFRLDLSLGYNLPSHGRYTHGVNVSVFNATAHKNQSVYYLYLGYDDFYYKPASFIIPVLPSISYYCKF